MISVSLSVSANKLVDAISKNIEQRAKCFMISSFYLERQRSPDGAPCATYGATHCWLFEFHANAQKFPTQIFDRIDKEEHKFRKNMIQKC